MRNVRVVFIVFFIVKFSFSEEPFVDFGWFSAKYLTENIPDQNTDTKRDATR